MIDFFEQGIRHQDLFLWDAWSVQKDGVINLFTLSIPRADEKQRPISPDDRNSHQFSIFRFESIDNGITWKAKGIHRRPNPSCLYQSGNVWSGSVSYIDETLVETFTGIKADSGERPFIQSLFIAELDTEFGSKMPQCLVSSERDYEQILDAGYFLQPKQQLGSVEGEAGGCITAWRDPFVFSADDQTLIAFAAKSADAAPAIGLLQLTGEISDPRPQLLPPVILPDTRDFTQVEVPKIVFIDALGAYLMLCSTTDRQSECQPGSQVDSRLRLYVAQRVQGPWKSAGTRTSIIDGVDGLFGATILEVDEVASRLICIAPYTSSACEALSLSFAPRFFIDLTDVGVKQQIHAYFD